MTDRDRGYNSVLQIFKPELDIKAVHKTTVFSFENLMVFSVLYETSFVPCVNKFITPNKKKSYDIARRRDVFFYQTPQCFNCTFLSKFLYFFVACEIICLYLSVVRTTNSLISFSMRSDYDNKYHYHSKQMFLSFHWPTAHHVTYK